MGGTQSKAAVNSVTKAVAEVAAQNIQSCVYTSTQSQNNTIVNAGFSLGGLFSATQGTDVKTECFQDSARQTKLQNDIANAISNVSTSTGDALWSAFGASKSDAVTNIKTELETKVTLTNIQTNLTAIKQDQKNSYTNTGLSLWDTVTFSQGAQLFAQATQKSVEDTGILTTIKNHVDQTSTAVTRSPFAFISDMVNSMSSATLASVVAFLICLLVACCSSCGAVLVLSQTGVSPQMTELMQAMQKR